MKIEGTLLFAAAVFAAGVSWAGPSCSVQVVDDLNRTSEVFVVSSKVSGSASALYTVTNGRGQAETAVVSSPSKPIGADDSVPHPTPDQLLASYGKAADSVVGQPTGKFGQLRLTVTGGSCDRFQVSLLLFWINEWFYF